MSASPYAKLSDLVMVKKTAALHKQINDLLGALNAEYKLTFELYPALPADPMRMELEHLCTQFTAHLSNYKDLQKVLTSNKKQIADLEAKLEKADKEEDATEQNDDDDDKIKYPPIMDLSPMKRAFINAGKTDPDTDRPYPPFASFLAADIPFQFYRGQYRYSADMTAKPDYMARNLNKSFVSRFEEEYADQLFVCFKVFAEVLPFDNFAYRYESYWLINSTNQDFMIFLMTGDAEDIAFKSISRDEFLQNFNRGGGEKDCMSVEFLH